MRLTDRMTGSRWRRAALVLPLALAGCATAADGTRSTFFDDVGLMFASCNGLSPSEASLCEAGKKHASTRLTGAASGAAVGCLVGLGAGVAASDDTGTRAAATGVGCAAGAFLGYAAGAYVDRVNTDAAGAQADLRGRIAAADEDAARYRSAANDADASVRAIRQDIASLNRDYAAGSVTANEYARRIDRAETAADALRALIVESAGTIGVVERDIGELQAAGRDTSGLQSRLQTLREQNARLVADYNELVRAIDTMPPGVERPNVA